MAGMNAVPRFMGARNTKWVRWWGFFFGCRPLADTAGHVGTEELRGQLCRVYSPCPYSATSRRWCNSGVGIVDGKNVHQMMGVETNLANELVQIYPIVT